MPLLCDDTALSEVPTRQRGISLAASPLPIRKQSQHSVIAKTAILTRYANNMSPEVSPLDHANGKAADPTLQKGSATLTAPKPAHRQGGSIGAALTDTPATTAPNTPKMYVIYSFGMFDAY
jgi:hypothetical protein